MRRRDCFGALACGAVGFMDGCRAALHTRDNLLRIATVPGVYSAPLHLAEELGYFAQAGLRIEIQQFSIDSETVMPLASGQIDAALAALTPAFVNTAAKGRSIRIVAGRQIASATCGSVGTLYGNRNVFPRGLSDLRSLKGKRIAVTSPTSFTAFCLDTFLSSVGLKAGEIERVSLRQQESIAALIAGKLDAAVVSQFDNDLEALSPSVIRGVGLAAILPDFQASYLMFGPSLIETFAGNGLSFLAAYLRATSEFMAGASPKFLDDYARGSRLDAEKLRRGCHGWFAKGGETDAASVQKSVDWMVSRGFCPQPLTPSQLIDPRFIRTVGVAKSGDNPKR